MQAVGEKPSKNFDTEKTLKEGKKKMQLCYYIALAAPPTRRQARESEPFLRPEVGFNPNWFHCRCGIDFSSRWHQDPCYRWETIQVMVETVRRCFPGYSIGGVEGNANPRDLITGVYGVAIIPATFGMTIRYSSNGWPQPFGPTLTDEEADRLQAPDLSRNEFFSGVLDQVDQAAHQSGSAEGYLNWQGVLNAAYRLRGEAIFTDMLETPSRARRIFDAVTSVIIQGARLLYERQRRAGFPVRFLSIGNCMLNMISPRLYRDLLLPYDLQLRSEFEGFGIHNCAWKLDPHMDAYATVSGLGYIDMGLSSNLRRARELFPEARRNLLYTSMDLKNKSWDAIRSDLDRIARELAPCDLGLPDIEEDVPDGRVRDVLNYCRELNEKAKPE